MIDKWQQCLETLIDLGYPQAAGSPKQWTQDDIDSLAALLGKRIYVYPFKWPEGNSQKLTVSIFSVQDFWPVRSIDTDQTEKLAATKEGLMEIVKEMEK